MQPTDPELRDALALLDAGEVELLHDMVIAKPLLLREVVQLDPAPPAYFAKPRLLWFIAENPIRNNTLSDRVVETTSALIQAARAVDVPSYTTDLTVTLGLVATGCVARQCGVQRALIETLSRAGGDANTPLLGAAAHGELEACEALLAQGASLTAPVAAAMGREEDLARELAAAEAQGDRTLNLQRALALAAVNGQAGCVRLALEAGADPNQMNPPGCHAHSTPLHQAVNRGHLDSVRTLIEAGADPSIKDRMFSGDALGWARHMGRGEIEAYLLNAAEPS